MTSDIVCVLDMSGSMDTMGQEPVQAMNAFIEDQKKVDDKARLSLYVFNTKVKHVLNEVPLCNVEKYTEYEPDGMTALYDAIDQAIDNKLKTQNNKNVNLVITTDGQDNMSQCSRKKVMEKIQMVEKDYNWKVFYQGANQDSFAEGASIGIVKSQCANFSQQTPGDYLRLMKATSAHVASNRSSMK